MFCIAAIFVKYSSTTVRKTLWNGTIAITYTFECPRIWPILSLERITVWKHHCTVVNLWNHVYFPYAISWHSRSIDLKIRKYVGICLYTCIWNRGFLTSTMILSYLFEHILPQFAICILSTLLNEMGEGIHRVIVEYFVGFENRIRNYIS